MIVQLLGTGSADGWPNPFCRCPSCTAERNAGRTRAASSALIDNLILIDIGPTVASAATRFGTSFADVEHVLITHGHPDHLAPDFLLWRGWVHPEFTLHIWAPAHAIARCRDWVGPTDAVTFHVISPGDVINLTSRRGEYVARVLPASHANGNGDVLAEEAVLFDITAPDHRTLFYATDTGPFDHNVYEAIRGRNFDLVLLDETFGNMGDHGHGHHDLATFSPTVSALRNIGAIHEATEVIAIHLSHHNPPTSQLAVHLAECGARVVDDGTIIEVGANTSIGRHHFIIGGARSGKSVFAESLALQYPNVTYVATGYLKADDQNWNERIAAHRERRPENWKTIETIDLVSVLNAATTSTCLLIDCLALWLTRTLDEIDGWSPDSRVRADASKEIHERTSQLLDALDETHAFVILVSNEVGQGVVPETSSGRLFRDLLGIINARIAPTCAAATFMIAGRSIPLDQFDAVRG